MKLRNKWITQKSISLSIILILLLEQIVPQYYFFMICVVLVGYLLVFRYHGKIHLGKMLRSPAIWIMFIIGILGGIIGIVRNEFGIWQVFRDMLWFSFVPLFIFIGTSIGEKLEFDYKCFYSSVFLFCGCYSAIRIIIRILNFISSGVVSFSSFVSTGGINQFVIAMGLFLAFAKPKEIEKHYFSFVWDLLLTISLTIGFVFVFSRTSLIILICLFATSGIKRVSTIFKVLLVLGVLLIIASALLPEVVGTYIDKLFNSLGEISSNRSSWNASEVVHNWRGYEGYCAVETYKEYNLWERIFGRGFGYLIDAKGYAYLVTGEEGLALLHNGYYTTLVKLGLVGLVTSIAYHIELCFISRSVPTEYERRLFIGLAFAYIITMFFMGGIIWGNAPLIGFLFMSWCVGEK